MGAQLRAGALAVLAPGQTRAPTEDEFMAKAYGLARARASTASRPDNCSARLEGAP